MVLQRGQPIEVWGFGAAAGDQLAVSLSEAGKPQSHSSARATVSASGRWQATIPEPKAEFTGKSMELTLGKVGSSSALKTLKNIVLGDVYIFAGQSNVDIPVAYAHQFDGDAMKSDEALADELGKNGSLRFMIVPTRCGLTQHYSSLNAAPEFAEVEDCKACSPPFGPQTSKNKCNSMGLKPSPETGYHYCCCDSLQWQPASGDQLRGFSAVAWFTGTWLLSMVKSLQGVPVGLVRTSWGASSIASWSSMDAVHECPQHGKPVHTFQPHLASTLWSHMVNPMIGLKFSAVVWVHGARNVGPPTPYMGSVYYGCMLKAMVRDWRLKFQQEDLPFIVVEMPVYCNEFGFKTWHTWCTQSKSALTAPDAQLPQMRLVQIAAEELPNVRTVSTMDQGSLKHSLGGTIHSVRKSDLGERVSLAIRAQVYKDACTVWSGPTASKAWNSGAGTVSICFDTRGGGDLVLNSTRKCPSKVLPVYCTGVDFEVRISGAWRPAVASMGSAERTVSLEVPKDAKVERVRYAWADWPVNGLTSSSGMPTRTFDLPVLDAAGDDASCPEGPKTGLDLEECRPTTTITATTTTVTTTVNTTVTTTATTEGTTITTETTTSSTLVLAPVVPAAGSAATTVPPSGNGSENSASQGSSFGELEREGEQWIENETENVNFTFVVAAMEETVGSLEHSLEDGVDHSPLRKPLHGRRLPPYALLLGLVTCLLLLAAAAAACCCGGRAWRKCASCDSGSTRQFEASSERMEACSSSGTTAGDAIPKLHGLQEQHAEREHSHSTNSGNAKMAMSPASAEDAPLLAA